EEQWLRKEWERQRREGAFDEQINEAKERKRRKEEGRPRNRREQPPIPSSASSHKHIFESTPSQCRHEKYWRKLSGAHYCNRCRQVFTSFVLECPDCYYRACNTCKLILTREIPTPEPKGPMH